MHNENINEVKNVTNQEEKVLSTYQDYLDKALRKRSNQLEDDTSYNTRLKGLEYRTIGTMKAPAIDWIYLVNGIEVVDTFVFNMDNPKYMDFTIDRLIDTLALYGEDWVSFETPESLVKKYQYLIDTKAVIRQYEYNGFKKYEVLATEKTSHI